MWNFLFNNLYAIFQSMLVTDVYTLGCIPEVTVLSCESVFIKKRKCRIKSQFHVFTCQNYKIWFYLFTKHYGI